MSLDSYFISGRNRNKLANFILSAFVIILFVALFAELKNDLILLWLTKPLLMPLLIGYYLRRTKKINFIYVIALLFAWLACVFLIDRTIQYIQFGVLSLLIFRVLTLYVVLDKIKPYKLRFFIIGLFPFLIIHAFIVFFIYNELSGVVNLFFVESIISVVLGGLSLGNYMASSKRYSFYLFVSMLLFSLSQFLYSFGFYIQDSSLFRLFDVVLFFIGVFLLIKYMFYVDRSKKRLETFEDLN